ncbi:MAG: glycosyltransferase family 10, partial [Gammaproteobacteria bacterium]
MTSQEDWALSHPDRIYSQAANHWIYGAGNSQVIDLDRLRETPPPEKTGLISMVWSNKSQRHTIHWKRNAFMKKIRDAMPELQVFGRGIRTMDDKAESIDPFKYHIAIENYVGLHHWTEKLSDPFLGYSLPFYYGCSNITDYFPAQSLISVDIEQFDQSLEIIRNAIRNNEYEKRLPYIIEARKLVIEKYNIFAVVSREIEKRHRPDRPETKNQVLKS